MFGLEFFKCKNAVLQMKYDAGRVVICMSEKNVFQENPFALTTRFMIMFSFVLCEDETNK